MTEAIRDFISKGQKYEGEFVTPMYITAATINSDEAKTFVSTDTKSSKILDSHGNTVEVVPASKGNLSVLLKFINGAWRVSEIKEAA